MISPFFAISNFFFSGTLCIFADYKRFGVNKVPRNKPLLVIANHQSNVDPPIIARSINRRTYFLAKREIFTNPLMTAVLNMWGAHPLSRGDADLSAIRWALRKLKKQGGCITLFPEGTRSRGSMRYAQHGPANIALRSGAVVLPVGITGTENLGTVLRVVNPSAKIRVNIGTPFRVLDVDGERKSMLHGVTKEMMGRIAELIPENYRGVYAEEARTERIYTADLLATQDYDDLTPKTHNAAKLE